MFIKKNVLNIEYILQMLPHRYPFILIDRIENYKKYKYLYAIKNCTINEPFFQGHFFNKPIVPGVLIIESIAQASALLIYKSVNMLCIRKTYFFVGVDKARFKKPVIPGDQMNIEVHWWKSIHKMIYFQGIVKVKKDIVCRSVIIFFKK